MKTIQRLIDLLFPEPEEPPAKPEPVTVAKWRPETNLRCVVCCVDVSKGEIVCPKHDQRLLRTKPPARTKRTS